MKRAPESALRSFAPSLREPTRHLVQSAVGLLHRAPGGPPHHHLGPFHGSLLAPPSHDHQAKHHACCRSHRHPVPEAAVHLAASPPSVRRRARRPVCLRVCLYLGCPRSAGQLAPPCRSWAPGYRWQVQGPARYPPRGHTPARCWPSQPPWDSRQGNPRPRCRPPPTGTS